MVKTVKTGKNQQQLQYIEVYRNTEIQETDLLIAHQQFTVILLNSTKTV